MGLTNFPNGIGTDVDGVLYATIADVSDASAISSWTGALPFDAEITGASVSIDTAVTTGDAVITFEIGAVVITAMEATILNAGSAAGSIFEAVAPTALNSLTAGVPVEVVTDGGSTVASAGAVSIYYKRV
jgi:hypothetical protein